MKILILKTQLQGDISKNWHSKAAKILGEVWGILNHVGSGIRRTPPAIFRRSKSFPQPADVYLNGIGTRGN